MRMEYKRKHKGDRLKGGVGGKRCSRIENRLGEGERFNTEDEKRG